MQVLHFITIIATAVYGELFNVHGVFFSKENSFGSVSASGQEVLIGSGKKMELKWVDEGSSLRDTASQKFLHIGDGPKRLVTLSDEKQKGFSVQDGFFAFGGKVTFCGEIVYFNNFDDRCEAVGITNLSKSEVQKKFESEASDDDFDKFDLGMRDKDDVEEEERLEKKQKSKDAPGKNGKSFKLTASLRGSPDMPIKKDNANPHRFYVGGNNGQNVVLKYQGKFVVDQDGKALGLAGKSKILGEVAPKRKPIRNFKIGNGRFREGFSSQWYTCPVGKTQVLAKEKCHKGKSIILNVIKA